MARTRTVLSLFDVNPRRIGGTELFARELSRQLDRLGFQSVLCFPAAPPPEVLAFLKLPNVTLAAPFHSKPCTEYAGSSRELAALLRRYRPEILHLHFVPMIAPYFWVARLCGTSRVFHTGQASHATPVLPSRAPGWKRFVGRMVTWPLKSAVGVSDYNAECEIRPGLVSPDRVTRIYNAVDVTRAPADAAAFRRTYSIPESRSIVLQVSWMIPEKGVPDLIDAAPLVLARNPNVQFVLAGDGACLGEYQARVRQMGLADHFTWTGLIRDIIPSGAYEAADIFCLVSRWGEAFGWVIAEAMAAGTPVVATRVGGIPELVDHGNSGFLTPPADPQQLADSLLTLLADPDLRQRMGAAGRRRAELLFNLETNVAELIKLYGIR